MDNIFYIWLIIFSIDLRQVMIDPPRVLTKPRWLECYIDNILQVVFSSIYKCQAQEVLYSNLINW